LTPHVVEFLDFEIRKISISEHKAYVLSFELSWKVPLKNTQTPVPIFFYKYCLSGLYKLPI